MKEPIRKFNCRLDWPSWKTPSGFPGRVFVMVACLPLLLGLGCRAKPSQAVPPAPSASAAPAPSASAPNAKELKACVKAVFSGLRAVAATRDMRFEGKVEEKTALCRGGQRALQFRNTPWVDWSNYWGTGDQTSLPKGPLSKLAAKNGVAGALLDLEYQRVELIKFNLFDNAGTYQQYISGRDGIGGPALKVWPEMRLASTHPRYADVGGDGAEVCKGDLLRWRTPDGICNDVLNPAMGSKGQLFARNVEFETTFPESNQSIYTRNRHGDRLGLLRPDPQVIPPPARTAKACPDTRSRPTVTINKRPSLMCWPPSGSSS